MLDAPTQDAPSKTGNEAPATEGKEAGTAQIKAYQFKKGKSGNPTADLRNNPLTRSLQSPRIRSKGPVYLR
jgi:hypothetical protein